MAHQPPIALIVFSNDMDSYLSNIEVERKIIEEALEHYHDTNRLKVIARSSVSSKELFRLFNRYKGRIVSFHFAGHATGSGLQLNDSTMNAEMGNAEGLASLFAREVKDGQLQFVFLNGCSTMPQVEGLQNAGVPSVIATNCPINDSKAVQFAQQFYSALSNVDSPTPFQKPTTIQQAFETALAYLNTNDKFEIEKTSRGLKLRRTKKEYAQPWVFFSKNTNWVLPNGKADENQVFNEYLIRRVMETLATKSKNKIANKFLQIANQKVIDWETNNSISDRAKNIVAYSFVGVLGIQLRKLFAIGKEPFSETKIKKYLTNSILTAKRTLKLVCFAMISKLWDAKKLNDYTLTESQRSVLEKFFNDVFDLDIQGYLDLMNTLFDIFETYRISFPMDELKNFKIELEPNSDLRQAIKKLQQTYIKLEKNKQRLPDCFLAERQLTKVLEKFSFLASYRMVSIKDVKYEEDRSKKRNYLHRYAALGIDSKFNINSERVNYTVDTVSTDAILLYKDRYQESVNLFPFIIDINALTFENGSKICFYHSKQLEDDSLNFCFLEDNAIENISYQATLEKVEDINEVMIDLNKRKAEKLDSVCLDFQAAKDIILEADNMDDFDDLMSEL